MSKSYSIEKTVQNVLGAVGIRELDISFTDPISAEVTVTLTQLWSFNPKIKDTVERAAPINPVPNDKLLSLEDLNQFKADNLNSLKQGTMLKKPFCIQLEKKSAKELFEISNRINKISSRSAHGLSVCPDCGGIRQVNCHRCSGYGLVLCPSCQGSQTGCSRCNKTGYIECPSCKGQKKIPCSKCHESGKVEVTTEIFCQADCTNLIEIEFDNKEQALDIPAVVVDKNSYQYIINSLNFHPYDNEYKNDDAFEIKLKAKASLFYLKFCIIGISKIFNFWTLGDKCIPLSLPKVLDISYAPLKAQLGELAVGANAANVASKLDLLDKLYKDNFFSSLLRSYENTYEFVTRRLNSDNAVQVTYSSELFTLKKRLESIVALRKEELARSLQDKLLLSTRGLMSEYFAKDCCMSLVEFMTNLKYRSKAVTQIWNITTLFMWGIALFVSCFIPRTSLLLGCFILALLGSVFISYVGTKNLLLYESMSSSKLFANPLKFLDINYDAFRTIVILSGVLILEIGVYLLH